MDSQSRPDCAHPLGELPSTTECWRGNEVAADLVHRSRQALNAVSSIYASRYSLVTPGPTDAIRSDHPLLPLGLLQGVALAPPCPPPFKKGRLSWVFGSSSAPLNRSATYPGIPTPSSTATSAVPPRLRGHTSDQSVPGLFHPGSTPEVHSSGDSPRTAARLLPQPSYPLAVITVATATPSGTTGVPRRNMNRLQGFALRSSPFAFPFPVRSPRRPFPS